MVTPYSHCVPLSLSLCEEAGKKYVTKSVTSKFSNLWSTYVISVLFVIICTSHKTMNYLFYIFLWPVPPTAFYIFIMDEKILVLCEKWLSKFSSNLYVLRPPESEKMVFTKNDVPEVLNVQMNEMQKKFFLVFFHFGDAVWLIHANK